MTAISVPGSSICSDASIQPEIVLTNYGRLDLTTASISYRINGGTPVVHSWSGTLQTGASATVQLDVFSPPASTFTIEAFVTAPNGGTDQAPGNDSVSKQTSTRALSGLPLAEGFEAAAFDPTTAGIYNYNPGDDAYEWERSDLYGAGGSSGQCP